MKTIDEIKVLLKLDGMTWEEEQSVSAMDRIWKYAVRIRRPNTEYGHVAGYATTLEEAWRNAWRRYGYRRNKSTAQA